MPNEGAEEEQCRVGTASLAEAVLDCLSTGMKIPVVFVFVVVFSSVISAVPAVSAVSAISAAPVVSGSLEVPEHTGQPVTPPPRS